MRGRKDDDMAAVVQVGGRVPQFRAIVLNVFEHVDVKDGVKATFYPEIIERAGQHFVRAFDLRGQAGIRLQDSPAGVL